ncbi:disease resistance protein RPP13-like [Cornus florida]|uniref:disease resistance protein RPP13-like n=1 Tax=Cornus florida TaxID=4283 RepID=UPI0028A026E1|nr:disease resistance protein RPP13-like [Cornus florida]
MADPAVGFLLENLKQLLVYNVDLISGVKKQVESLCTDFDLMQAFLKDSNEKRSEYETLRVLVRKIRDVAYEAEDIIDTFVVNAAVQKARSTMGKIVHAVDYTLTLRSVAKDIEEIKAKVKEIYDHKIFGIEVLQSSEPSKKGSSKRKAPVVEEHNVVGFDDEAKMVIERLTEGPQDLEVVSVVGMGGLGKTTLARKVYTDPSIEYHFCVRAWTYVSQVYDRREIFLGILNSLNLLTDQMYKMNDERLREELCTQLKNGKFLIVIDDVWTKEAWEDLKTAFPNSNNGSRILLTSRITEVALRANHISPPHYLRFLTDDESWELLCRKVFQRGSCPSELEDLGKKIAKKCYGLPLAIVVVAGLLSIRKDKTRDWWNRVAESVSRYAAKDPEGCMEVLALSYKHLPHHLRVCFIYFGIFPEDFEIPVWKLLHLWVAEGLVQQKEQEWLEDTAEEYLEYLVDRNLVLVEKRRLNGRIKTCRIHDMLRDLCLREATEENFLKEIKGNVQSPSLTPDPNHPRRLCIHSQVLDYISLKPSGPRVRSFLCFASEERELPREYTPFIHEAFKLIRVLDIRSVSLSRFPSEIIQLVHLRYIALFGKFKVVPSTISNLWNLQTLIVETTSRDLDIQADIWKMLWFRHLYTSGSSRLHGPPAKTRKDMVRRNIQTISTVSPDSCTDIILARTPNLKKLGIRGKLVALMEEKAGSSMFDNLSKLDQLETLKLLNDTFPRPPLEGKLSGLPQWYKFPRNLKKLTLSDTFLDWEHMSMLGKLPNLEVLKLKDFAFKGQRWVPLHGGFRLLKVLQLGRTDLVHWEASGHHFPRLQRIILRHCINLEAIPFGLADVSALQIMELYCTSSSAAMSARFIQQERKEKQQEQGIINNELKLLIYPPDW